MDYTYNASDLCAKAGEPVNGMTDEASNAMDSVVAATESIADIDGANELTSIAVDLQQDVEAVSISEIADTYGRLSDIVENVEQELGVSVVPLRMVNISTDVKALQRHEIFEFGGERYAFSKNVRKNVCERIVENIVANITNGIPYTLDLVTGITRGDETYKSLLLSRAEWTYIMSRCRVLRQELKTDGAQCMTLTVYAERIDG